MNKSLSFDVFVIYNEDAIYWSEFIENYLNKLEEYDLKISSAVDSSILISHLSSRSIKCLSSSKVTIVIMSPGHLDFLKTPIDSSLYEEVLWRGGQTLLLFCGVDKMEEEERSGQWKLSEQFPNYNKSIKFLHTEHDKLLTTAIQIVESSSAALYDKGNGERGSTKRGDSGIEDIEREMTDISRGQTKKGKNTKKRSSFVSKNFELVPPRARCEEPTIITILFDENTLSEEEMEERENREMRTCDDVVTIAFGSNVTDSRLILAKRMNKYTFSFFVPEHNEGVVPVRVILNGQEIGQKSLLYYSLEGDLVTSVSQIYMYLIDQLLDLIKTQTQNHQEVDRRLSQLLTKDLEDEIPIQAFEQLFTLSGSVNASKKQSKCELPSLLHCSVKYGLKELTMGLIDLPDAKMAACVENRNGMTPEKIATSRGFHELAECLKTLKNRQENDCQLSCQNNNFTENPYETFFPSSQSSSSQCHQTNMMTSALRDDRLQQQQQKNDDEDPYKITTLASKNDDDKTIDEDPYMLIPFSTNRVDKSVSVELSMESDQAELIEIMEKVKMKQVTVLEAEILFTEWKQKHSNKNSPLNTTFVSAKAEEEEEEKIDLTTEIEKMDVKSKHKNIFSSLFDKKSQSSSNVVLKKSKPAPPPDKKLTSGKSWFRQTSLQESNAVDNHEFQSSPRNSLTSNSSRESCTSRGSGRSAVETINEKEIETETAVIKRSSGHRRASVDSCSQKKSIILEKLEEELKSPYAPRPPALPPRKLSTPAFPAFPPPPPPSPAASNIQTSTLMRRASVDSTRSSIIVDDNDYLPMTSFSSSKRTSWRVAEEVGLTKQKDEDTTTSSSSSQFTNIKQIRERKISAPLISMGFIHNNMMTTPQDLTIPEEFSLNKKTFDRPLPQKSGPQRKISLPARPGDLIILSNTSHDMTSPAVTSSSPMAGFTAKGLRPLPPSPPAKKTTTAAVRI